MSHECNLPIDGQGKFYHIDCAPGDIAPYILACANPERSHVMAEFLDSRELKGKNREYVVYTGFYRNVPLSIMGSGIGGPAAAIAIVEAAQCQHNATFIRVGTSGAIQPQIAPGDLIITDKCIRDENTSHYYAEPSHRIRNISPIAYLPAKKCCKPVQESIIKHPVSFGKLEKAFHTRSADSKNFT